MAEEKNRPSNDRAPSGGNGHLRPIILSLTLTYPNRLDRQMGLFVARRLKALSALADITVAAPVSVVKYRNPGRKLPTVAMPALPTTHEEGSVRVLHPAWFHLPFSGVLTPFWLWSFLVIPMLRLRTKFPYELVDTHFGHPDGVAGWLLAASAGVPFTMTFRGNEPVHARYPLRRFVMKQAARRAARIFAVSERLRQFAISLGAAPDVVKTIPNGIDSGVFFPRDRAAARLKLDWPPNVPVILSAGGLVPRKGHHRIMEALKRLPSELHPILAIAGGPGPEGYFEQSLRQMAINLDLGQRVRFLGVLPPEEMAAAMSAADVLCLASTNEGWPNVVHEALGCGTPVVATDVGAIPDMLPGSRYGIVVPPQDEEALAQGLRVALEREWDRKAISEWGRARSWGQVATEVFTEMQAVLAGRRGT